MASEACCAYPITPSTTMAALYQQAVADGRANLWGTPLAFICHHGNSSRNAAEHFREHGFTDLYNVEGGIDAWSKDVDPSIKRY